MKELEEIGGVTFGHVSRWKRPGGKLGMVVAGLGIVGAGFLLYKALPYMIAMTTNIITLILLLVALFLIVSLLLDKRFRRIFSNCYFLVMRKITGLFVEVDPIGIVEKRLTSLRKKMIEIRKNMSALNSFNIMLERNIDKKKEELEKQLLLLKSENESGDFDESRMREKQVVRLRANIARNQERHEESLKWYRVLSKLNKEVCLTIQDTENEVNERKEEYHLVKAQHKAFENIMGVLRGDKEYADDYDLAMEHMAYDIAKRIGEMDEVISETGGIVAKVTAENSVMKHKADEILKLFEEKGIDGLFEAIKSRKEIESKATPTVVFPKQKTGVKEAVLQENKF